MEVAEHGPAFAQVGPLPAVFVSFGRQVLHMRVIVSMFSCLLCPLKTHCPPETYGNLAAMGLVKRCSLQIASAMFDASCGSSWPCRLTMQLLAQQQC